MPSGGDPVAGDDAGACTGVTQSRGRQIGAVVLAAGRATRLGRPKATLPVAGRTLLDRVLDAALAAGLAQGIVVLAPGDDEAARIVAARALPAWRTVVARDAAAGQSRSLAAGLAALDPSIDAAAILLVDQPETDPAVIRRVLDAASRSDRPAVRPVHPAPACTTPVHVDCADRAAVEADRVRFPPVHEGPADDAPADRGRSPVRVPGHPVVLHRQLFAAACALRGDEGARALWRDEPDRLESVHVDSPAPPDVDTPEDLAALVRRLVPRTPRDADRPA